MEINLEKKLWTHVYKSNQPNTEIIPQFHIIIQRLTSTSHSVLQSKKQGMETQKPKNELAENIFFDDGNVIPGMGRVILFPTKSNLPPGPPHFPSNGYRKFSPRG